MANLGKKIINGMLEEADKTNAVRHLMEIAFQQKNFIKDFFYSIPFSAQMHETKTNLIKKIENAQRGAREGKDYTLVLKIISLPNAQFERQDKNECGQYDHIQLLD